MGIFNFGKKNSQPEPQATVPQPSVQPAATAATGGREVTLDLKKNGILNLQKNDFLNLSKTSSTLQHIRVSAGWDVNAGWGSDYDLDLCAILLDANGKLTRSGNSCIYYGRKQGQGIELDHDNLTGEGEGDDENMFVNFSQIHPDVHKIIVCVVIYSAASRNQSFKHVKNAYVRLVDEGVRPEDEICRYNLSADGGNNTAVKFAELTRTDSGWTFRAVGDYLQASIENIRNQYA